MTCPFCQTEKRGAVCPGCGRAEGMPATRTPRRRKHRRHDPAPTSRAAIPSKSTTDEQYDRIISCLREHGELTRDAISKYTTLPINVTTPRVRELLDAGRLVDGMTVLNPGTGRYARLVLLLANHIGRLDVLKQALQAARDSGR